MYHTLERFLFSLNIPFITSLRDTQFYTKAVEQGIGVLEIKHTNVKVDHEQWAPLLRWLDGPLINDETEADITPLFSQHQGTQI